MIARIVLPTRLVLIRHAIRGPLSAGVDNRRVPITAAGRTAAVLFGLAQAGGPPLALAYSPTARTTQTAEMILLGARAAGVPVLDLGPRHVLGEGAVLSTGRARAHLVRLGAAFSREWLAERLPTCDVPDPHRVAAQVTALAAYETVRAPGRMLMFVTHDWHVMSVRAWLSPCGALAEPPGFLDGIELDLPIE